MMADQSHISTAPKTANRSGFSLIEVLIAISLLAMFVAGSVRVLTVLRRSSDLSRMNYLAVNMAKDRIERVRAFDYHQLDAAREPPNVLSEGLFRRTTIVTNAFVNDHAVPPFVVPTNVQTGLKQITVIVETLNPRTRRFDGPRQEVSTIIANTEAAP